MKTLAKIGSKIKFKGISAFWFTNMSEAAAKLLVVGNEYTVHELQTNSSWTSVILKEFPDYKFSLSWFETSETMEPNKFKVKVIRDQVIKNQEASDRLYTELAESLGVDKEDQEAHDFLHDAIFNSSNEEDFNYAIDWFDVKMADARERRMKKQLAESSLRIRQALSHIKTPYTKLQILDMWLSGKFNAELLLHHALLELAK
jgi:hypothetical protein